MSDLLKIIESFDGALGASATAAGVDLPEKVVNHIAYLKSYSMKVEAKLKEIKAEAEADAEAKAQAEAEAKAQADVNFINWLDNNDFAAFHGKGGKVAVKLKAALKNEAEGEANLLFGLLQTQAEDCSFDLQKFKSFLYNYEYNDENRYALIVHLNIKGGIKLQNFGGAEVGTYFK